MGIESAIRTRLQQPSAITDLVSARVYPLTAPQSGSLPYIVTSLDSESRSERPSGGLVEASIEVDIVAATYVSAKAIAAAVRSTLDTWRGTSESIEVRGAFLVSQGDEYDPPQRGTSTGFYHVLQTWQVWYRETVPQFV